MSRTFFILDAGGERRLTEAALPLRVGGGQRANIVLPGLPKESVVATIALSRGHAFVQPEDETLPLYHNHERLLSSAWLKSGDQLEVDDAVIDWEVKGDQVFVRVGKRIPNREPIPPRDAPPGRTPRSQAPENSLPVNTTPTNGSRRSLLRKLIIGLFSLLLLATAAFVLLATPVQINIEPAPDRQSLRGKIPALPLWGRRMALPGEYTLAAERKGYQPLSETLRISPGGTPRFDFRLKELPGRIEVRTIPETPFRLFVDSVETEAKGGIAEIDRGRRLLRIESERHLPEEKEVEIEGLGESRQVEFELRPAWAELAVSSLPAGAEVRIDDQVLGATPLRAEVMQGPRTLTLTFAGYKPLTLKLAVEAGKPLRYENLELQPLDGRLLLESDPTGATVTADGEYRGIAPLTLTLSSGQPHALTLSKPGYRTSAQQAQVAADEERRETIKLQPEIGVVFLRTRPADAELLIDGKPAGKATRRLRLPARPHELEIRKQGYAPQKISVTPRSGESQSIEVNLKSETEQKTAKPPTAINAPKKAMEKSAGKQPGAGGDPTLRLIQPDGPFAMGASRREAGRRANESLRKVQLTRPYHLGAEEVTNAEFRRFRPQHDSGSLDGARLNGDNQPVVNISWNDAARYCNWLSKQSGLPAAYREQDGHMSAIKPIPAGYRLPTEAEWAYAARINDRDQPARYAWPGQFPPKADAGNYADRQLADTLADVVPGYDDGHRGTAPVGSFAESPKDFYDFGGNVAEWTGDYYAVYPGESDKLVRDPTGSDNGAHHVVRGSGWRHGNITELRLSYRDYSQQPRPDLGFRVARYAN